VRGSRFDWVVTVCDRARQSCPVFPGARTVHWDLPDPAEARGSEEEVAEAFRRVRDELARRVAELLALLEGQG
jgi:arsenate reductase